MCPEDLPGAAANAGSTRYESKLRELSETVSRLTAKYGARDDLLIQVLLDLQGELRWLPAEALMEVSRQLDVPLARIYRIATFYKAFSLAPRGRYVIRVCTGTACQVRGAPLVVSVAERLLKIACGETTPDMQFTLETVNCVGCCPIAPVVLCNESYHPHVSPSRVREILATYK